jgi:hypothetical protein
MTYFPRLRPVLGVARWCGFVLAAFLTAIVGMMLGTVVAGVVRG